MGGAVHMNLNEFNFTSDPEAAEIVLQSKAKKKVVTLDVTFKCALDKEQIERLRACKSEVVGKVLRMSELWGEGMIWYDAMRLNKGVDRRGGGFPASAVFNIPANSPILLWRIPQTEINANIALSDADNDFRTEAAPKAVKDEE